MMFSVSGELAMMAEHVCFKVIFLTFLEQFPILQYTNNLFVPWKFLSYARGFGAVRV